ncbi:MAG: hypothetical protein QGH45_07515, partial [Myxococcota bacterium]|nr:hypothetical protein [Myxococcota bacterium]
MLLAVYQAQAAGRSPVSIVHIAKELGLAVYLADRIAGQLAARGLVRLAGTSRWEQLEPCLAPESITLARVALAVSSDPLAVPAEQVDGDPSVQELAARLRGVRTTLLIPMRETTVAELLATE